MSSDSVLAPFATALLGFAAVAAIFLMTDVVHAGDAVDRPGPAAHSGTNPIPRGTLLPPRLDLADRIAALETVQYALSEVGDGSSYVWHRGSGELSAVVSPTVSFRNASGGVCRHVVVLLAAGHRSMRTEGVACRLANGVWQLDG